MVAKWDEVGNLIIFISTCLNYENRNSNMKNKKISKKSHKK